MSKRKQKKVVVILSGGMDSAVLLYHHLSLGHEVRTLSFNYGQRHIRELVYAAALVDPMRTPGITSHEIVNLSSLQAILPGSSQTDDKVAVPEGRYDEESMKVTVVPNRNMIMLAIAAGHAIAHKMDAVSFAAHAGDHAIYPDCRENFTKALNRAIGLADWHKVKLLRPFIHLTKAEIVAVGSKLEVPFSHTYSCYNGNNHHCGRCGTCVERREAFYVAAVCDPTDYAADAPPTEALYHAGWDPNKIKPLQ